MKKILVPTDFYLTSRWASETALDIAKRSAAEVFLLHLVEQPIPQSFNAQGQIDGSEGWEDRFYTFKLIEKGKLDLSNRAEEFSSPQVRVTQVMRIRNPYHAISTTIANQNIDLVVMGTCGNSWLEKLLVGSTTDKVIRFSKCPVLTMNQKPSS